MQLPFSESQFLDVFAEYNLAFRPFVILLWMASLAVGVALVRNRAHAVMVSILAAVHWGWSGIAYHLAVFTRINPAAWMFGALFLLQALLFIWFGIVGRRLTFGWAWTTRHTVAAVFLVYSLLYPVFVLLSGHEWPRAPIFAVPCPTALFTTGLLLTMNAPAPRLLFVVPIIWSLIGGSAALVLGMTPDLMLFAAAAILIFCVLVPGAFGRRELQGRV
jgi:uncharacterized protein DUF6064